MITITKLRYGNTNTYFIKSNNYGLLIDTDYAGTLQSFYKLIKEDNIKISDFTYVIATHYHPDHMGLISELMDIGVKLIVIDKQLDYLHFSDNIFKKDNIKYTPINDKDATIVSLDESRNFLSSLGINGRIISTPSHSNDSISIILDNGECFVGDLEPYEYIDCYDDSSLLKSDWDNINSNNPNVIYFSHRPEKFN